MKPQKPHYAIPIHECGEPLVPIPGDRLAIETPHPYAKLGAPYGSKSPFCLRQSVLNQLLLAQNVLKETRPGWKIQIFDAYRPLAVQQFMVDYTFAETVRVQGLTINQLSDPLRETLLQQVYQFWAVPSADPATPPPHSTGAAVDVTLADAAGHVVNMGSPIDELSPRSYPNFFMPGEGECKGDDAGAIADATTLIFHSHRQLLHRVMSAAGFRQHPNEWWHFSWHDQLWAWLMRQDDPTATAVARYGAVEHMPIRHSMIRPSGF